MTTENDSNNQELQDDYELASNELEADAPEPKKQPEPKEPPKTEDPKPKKMGGYQRRIHNLSQENTSLTQRNAELEQELARMRGGDTPKIQPKPKQQADGEPNPEDYDDVFEFLKDSNKWAAEQAIKNYKSEQETHAVNAEYEEKQASFNDRVESTILQTVPDFYERAAALYQAGLVTETMEQALLDSPIGEIISLYYMAHQDELVELAQMTPYQQMSAIAKTEAKLQSAQQSRANPQPRRTAAPPPVNPVKKTARTQVSLSDEEMSYEDWKKLRERNMS